MNYLANLDVPKEIGRRETDPLTSNIIGAAIDVHRALGPGLLESAYEACLLHELRLRRLVEGIHRMKYTTPLCVIYGPCGSLYFCNIAIYLIRD